MTATADILHPVIIADPRTPGDPLHNSLRTVINRTRAVSFDVAWNGAVAEQLTAAAQQLSSDLGSRGA